MRPDLLERLKRGVLGGQPKNGRNWRDTRNRQADATASAGVTPVTVTAATSPKPLRLQGYTRYASNSASTETFVHGASPVTNESCSEPVTATVAGVAAADLHALRDDDWQVAFDERAAILEYDAGLSRAEAEARALAECVAKQASFSGSTILKTRTSS